MSLVWLPVLLPLLAAPLTALPGWRTAYAVRLGTASLWLLLALALCALPQEGAEGLLRPDALNLVLLVLAGAIGLTAAALPPPDRSQDAPTLLRAAEGAAWHVFLAAVALALLADSLALAWLGLMVATLAAAVMVALGTPTVRAARAAWRLLLLGGVGLLLALFGLAVLHRATIDAGDLGLSWAALRLAAVEADPRLLDLSFVCLLLGQGVLAGLAPPAALSAAEETAPPPVAALLAGVLPVAALHGLLRAKAVAAAHPESLTPAITLAALGLAALLLAALALWRQRRRAASWAAARGRVLAWGGVAQTGAAAFAFGLGGAAANGAGLLLLLGQALVRSGLHLRPAEASRGSSGPAEAGCGVLGLLLLAGLPPGVLFAGQFALMAETAGRAPWLAPLIGGGIALAMGALLAAALRPSLSVGAAAALVPSRAASVPGRPPDRRRIGDVLLALHLLAVLLLGLTMPAGVARFLDEAARLIG
ncbi:MAG: hypothetical protein IRZ13_20080 [Acetobacteraceae bacterium]|nr:hypothetical protein [Acetobacteraceae bacterium]